MKITEKIFDACYILEPSLRQDMRGQMQVFYDDTEIKNLLDGFEIGEQRIYRIPGKHTFYGIHYQKPGKAKGKLISVIQGRALDYIVDLRPDSDTYRQYKMFELNETMPRLIYLPAGFGHGFLTLEDNTIQVFAVDPHSERENSGVVNYKDPSIGLVLPVEEVIISDYDRDAEFS